jgi:integrase
MAKFKLTQTSIKDLRANPSGNRLYRDTEVRGFALRITPKDARSFVFVWGRGALRRSIVLGQVGAVTVDEARKAARAHRVAVDRGADPAAERQALKAAVTVAELIARFLAEHAARKAPATAKLYRRLLERHVTPALGARLADTVSWRDLASLHSSLSAHPVTANRTIVLCGKVWAWGAKSGILDRDRQNPARDHDRLREQRRGRALSREQLGRIGEALDREPEGSLPAACFRFLLLTGTRPSEAIQARWQDIDLEARLWRLRQAKTGPRVVYLGAPAGELLRALPRIDGSAFIFPGRSVQKPIYDLRPLWGRLQAAAELPQGMRLYDATRHTFATWATELGVPRDIRKLLTGHAPGGEAHDTYMHVTHEPLRQADRVSGWLRAALDREPEPSAEALPAQA